MNAYYIIINRSSWELIVHLASSITFLSMVIPAVHWLCDGHLYVHAARSIYGNRISAIRTFLVFDRR